MNKSVGIGFRIMPLQRGIFLLSLSLITFKKFLNTSKSYYEELFNNLTNMSMIPQPNESKDLVVMILRQTSASFLKSTVIS